MCIYLKREMQEKLSDKVPTVKKEVTPHIKFIKTAHKTNTNSPSQKPKI